MTKYKKLELLKKDIFSDNSSKIEKAINQIFEIGGKDNLEYLFGLLNQENSNIRNIVALLIRDKKINEALEPLFYSINRMEFKGYTGTMVYALEKLDCSKKFNELFDLLFNESSYEVQHHVLTILNNQTFEFTRDDLIRIKSKWNKLKLNWNNLNKVDEENLSEFDIHKEVIQDFVDGYLIYLDDDN